MRSVEMGVNECFALKSKFLQINSMLPQKLQTFCVKNMRTVSFFTVIKQLILSSASLEIVFFSKHVICQSRNNIDLTRTILT